jgi:hypothetical protein
MLRVFKAKVICNFANRFVVRKSFPHKWNFFLDLMYDSVKFILKKIQIVYLIKNYFCKLYPCLYNKIQK